MAAIIAQEKIWFNGKLVDWDDAKIHILSSVIHFGSGCCALWQPEEPFLHRRLGQPGPAQK